VCVCACVCPLFVPLVWSLRGQLPRRHGWAPDKNGLTKLLVYTSFKEAPQCTACLKFVSSDLGLPQGLTQDRCELSYRWFHRVLGMIPAYGGEGIPSSWVQRRPPKTHAISA